MARIILRAIGSGNTRRFAGIEEAQIRSTLEVAKNVFNTIPLPGVGALLYLANRFTAKEMLGKELRVPKSLPYLPLDGRDLV